jgi:hypothetical protein
MNAWFLLIPIASFAAGALLFRLLLFMLLRPAVLQRTLTEMVVSMNDQKVFDDPRQVQKILPLAEEHIDFFLRHKLSATLPQIALFIGDKTIHQFKKIFMLELEQWLPGFIQSYMTSMTTSPLVSEKRLLSTVAKKISNLLVVKIVCIGGAFGLVLALLEWLLVYGARFIPLTNH